MNAAKVSIGRFRLAVPEGTEVSTREQAIYAVKVWNAPAAWPARLAALGPQIISQPSLPSGGSAAWYEEKSVQLLEAAKPYGDHALWLLRDAPKGKEPQAEKLVSNVMNGYHDNVDSGFCVGVGAVRLGPAQLETTRLVYKAKTNPALKITFTTQTVDRPDLSQYMDTKEEEDVMRVVKGRLQVFKQKPRALAGLEGMEIHLSMAPPNEPEIIRYTWHFPGVPGDGTQPKINIVAFTSPDRRAELDPVWEALIASLAKVPK